MNKISLFWRLSLSILSINRCHAYTQLNHPTFLQHGFFPWGFLATRPEDDGSICLCECGTKCAWEKKRSWEKIRTLIVRVCSEVRVENVELTDRWLANWWHIIIFILHLLMALGSQISEYWWDVHVLFDRCTNQSTAKVSTQMLHFFTVIMYI